MTRNHVPSGFTLVETLVAIAILSIAVAAPLYTASRAIVAAQLSGEQLAASYLAQEGVEYARAMRDDEYLAYYEATPGGNGVTLASWNDFLNGNGSGSVTSCRANACSFNPAYPVGSAGSITACTGGGSCGQLYLASGAYTDQSDAYGALATPYTRTLQIQNITGAPTDANGNPVDVRVVSTVTWNSHGALRTVTTTDHLTSWH